MIKRIFGIPILKTNVSSILFDKDSIVNTIQKNYNKSKTRNNWRKHNIYTLHHSLFDVNNEEFDRPDYSSLIDVYSKTYEQLFSEIDIYSRFEFTIANYTAMSGDQGIDNHVHPGSDYASVHYIQVPKEGSIIRFTNPNPWTIYNAQPRHLMGKDGEDFSYSFHYWNEIVVEGDIIIFPSFLVHDVPAHLTNSENNLRISIATNISFDTFPNEQTDY